MDEELKRTAAKSAGEDDPDVPLLRERFGPAILGVESQRGQTVVLVEPGEIVPVCRFLKEEQGYNYLSFIFSVDCLKLPRWHRFELIYGLYSLPRKKRLRLKVPLPEEGPVVDSVRGVWATADFHEREAFDMMGISFRGHPDLKRILMPDDWVGHPHRRDYDLRVEDVEYTFLRVERKLAKD